ncbi:NADPH-dependent F420 reductase [Modestobacter sp. VKM Ac-2979]|uniref:NADPH-dependent F420 reductase n=1 Tax=unclassified Modestobacter TaxID=2643866 RepID=UPI0022AB7BC8|nr:MULTISPECIES: NADPH-dependent F420 reductase [unclassified Modestobacter]MCZ2813954.1 NADPH-dependent F420 reductase [Modestobacter sp. VKM Ac-2979]MCZ2844631.1 NADPH-dependent F420 reductase [Modestobacter sp. VKM Ac-2980]
MSDIAVLGGTGPQGKGLALRLAEAGRTVTIGSRSAERAQETADAINDRLRVPAVEGATNTDACGAADMVLLAVPYDGHAELVESLRAELAGKVVISCVNPLGFDAHGPYELDIPDRSAAEEAARLAPEARLIGAFHHVSAVNLWKEVSLEHEDVLVCGDDAEAKNQVMDLVQAVCGHAGVDAGPLRMARQLEPLTAVLININKRYKVRSGLAVTGLPANH